MRMFKNVLAGLLVLALLACVPVASVAAADAGNPVFTDTVPHSITTEEETGNGLAFLFTLNLQGAQKDAAHYYVADSATITLDGVTYTVASMGAVATNDVSVAKDAAQLVRENVRDNRTLVDIKAERLTDATATSCSFAVRIIRLPDAHLASAVAVRPYCVLKSAAGDETTIYGAVNVSTFRYEWHKKDGNAAQLPAIGSDIDVVKKKNRIRVSAATATYALDADFNEILTVSLTFRNYTSNWITEETDYIQYTYYDATGAKIKTETLYIGCIDTKKHPTKTFTFTVPTHTAEVRITNSKIVYWTEWA